VKLLFLGVLAAFSVGDKSFQSNMLIENESGSKLLIDCGSDARLSLFAQGYGHNDIDAVYISHLHSDHVGGLEWLGFTKRFIDSQKPRLYISADQIDKLWKNVLSGGMSSLEGEEATLSTYFDVKAISNGYFIWENYLFELIKTHHYICNREILPSYGLLIQNTRQKIFISTDTRFTPDNLQLVYNKADIIFHDCETSTTISGQHAHYNDLKNLDSKIKQKMWLYDYNQGELPNAQKDGFQGFVVRGQRFKL
jgi:ribonuclease BN (tRNA processing enzyme)